MQKPSARAGRVYQAAGDLQGGMRGDGPSIFNPLPHPETQIQCQAQEEVGGVSLLQALQGSSDLLANTNTGCGAPGLCGLEAGAGTDSELVTPPGLLKEVFWGCRGCQAQAGVLLLSLSLSFPIALWALGTVIRSPGFLFLFALEALRFPLLDVRCSLCNFGYSSLSFPATQLSGN